ncbi:leucyl aminopeptidase [Hyphococcus luteus]|uniref:Probable cytosol aminopeptidase n=1 Tax=Hyphococcus luteus TaxID=2058213 RepID=A0A2S7K8X7_9PROT|nr:leucyl aminopeptidase [Marinicaulis flavus]PQA88938.1 leucyl aminopeptidase [Marinicaulis flavus]
MQINFSAAALPKSGAIIMPVFEDGAKPKAYDDLDKATDGAVARAVKAADFKAKKGKMLDIVAPAGLGNSRILLVGAGPSKDFTALDAEALGGNAAGKLLAGRDKSAAIALSGLSIKKPAADELAARIALGARMKAYRFDKYRTKEKKEDKPVLNKVTIATSSTKAKDVYADYEKIGDGVFLTRDLVSEPANILYPESFAKRCQELADLGVKVTVLTEAQMKKLGMGSLLGVAQGSSRPPKLVAMEWMGGKKGDAPVAFVGKGVTFDTGGISLKPAGGMEDMKWDMGGAGAVTGAMAAIAGRKAKANVIGVVGLVENMPDGNAQRPGDVVKSMSGQTIEVLNTDAEGRLVLADALWWTQETYKPKTVIDLATLTGAIIVSLANEFGGMFTKDDKLAKALDAASETSGDKLWRMPLTKAHDEMIKSEIADMQNIGGKGGGSSTAAAFLGRFIKDDVSWAHLDIAGMAWSTKDKPTCPKGGTGFGVRLLDEYVRANCEG